MIIIDDHDAAAADDERVDDKGVDVDDVDDIEKVEKDGDDKEDVWISLDI